MPADVSNPYRPASPTIPDDSMFSAKLHTKTGGEKLKRSRIRKEG